MSRQAYIVPGFVEKALAHTLLSKEETYELLKRIQENDDKDAVSKLLSHNYRFIYNITSKYVSVYDTLFWELFSEGCLGAIKAAHDFDMTRDLKFISYAVWWIRQGISRYLLDKKHLIRVPASKRISLKRSRKQKLIDERGELPKSEAVLRQMVSSEYVTDNVMSFSDPVQGVDGKTIGDTIFQEPEQEQDDLYGVASTILSVLPQEDKELLMRYYGLDTGEESTLADVAVELGISRERVRQRKQRALSRAYHAAVGLRIESKLELGNT